MSTDHPKDSFHNYLIDARQHFESRNVEQGLETLTYALQELGNWIERIESQLQKTSQND